MATKKFGFRADHSVDGDGPTNAKRAAWAEAGVRAFLKASGETEAVDEDSIRDLMADLLHLCDREGVDAQAAVDWALRRWEEER